MTHKFYQDLAAWLELWLQTNVGTNPNKLPVDLDLKHITNIVIGAVYRHVRTLYKRGCTRQTAEIFEKSSDTISRAVKNLSI
jgi:hypothetical protein